MHIPWKTKPGKPKTEASWWDVCMCILLKCMKCGVSKRSPKRSQNPRKSVVCRPAPNALYCDKFFCCTSHCKGLVNKQSVAVAWCTHSVGLQPQSSLCIGQSRPPQEACWKLSATWQNAARPLRQTRRRRNREQRRANGLLLLVAMPFATSSVLAPSSKARSP